MVNENKIGVIGAGTMGAGIAQVAVQGGFDAVVYDVSQEFLDRGLGRIHGFIGRSREKGNIDEAEEKRILSRLKGSLAMEDLADATLVVEAATENLQVSGNCSRSWTRPVPRKRCWRPTPRPCR